MSRVVICFAHNAGREKITQLTERCGITVRHVCRSGAEAIRAVRTMGGGVVVCGYKLADMTGDELARSLGKQAQVLFVASPVNLAMLEDPRAERVASPVRASEYRDTLRELIERDEKENLAALHRRTPAETALIEHAKAILMAKGMTEAEAHSYLQQKSMEHRVRMTDTASDIIREEEAGK